MGGIGTEVEAEEVASCWFRLKGKAGEGWAGGTGPLSSAASIRANREDISEVKDAMRRSILRIRMSAT